MKTIATIPRVLKIQSLFELLKKDDPSVMAYLYNRYSRRLFGIGREMIRDEFVVESLVQDVFLKLWLNRHTIKDPEHIFFFLRFVMKRDCISYYTRPRNRFFRTVQSLDRFENFQDYLVGYDPMKDAEHLRDQAKDDKAMEKVKAILLFLSPKRRHLIELCLQYGFRYKAIAQVMGTSVTDTSNEVKSAIADIKNILEGSSFGSRKKIVEKVEAVSPELTPLRAEILRLRYEEIYSFAQIALALGLSVKEVHQEFLKAYPLLHSAQKSDKTV